MQFKGKGVKLKSEEIFFILHFCFNILFHSPICCMSAVTGICLFLCDNFLFTNYSCKPSGSLIVEYETNKAVGLLFAGNQSDETFANPINKVLDAFDVIIA